MARDTIRIDVGGDHPFWDVFPSDKVYKKARVSRDDMPSISVVVDEGGNVRFNNGYKPGSDDWNSETMLFELCRTDIVEALAEQIGNRFADEPRYAAFLKEHGAAPGPKR